MTTGVAGGSVGHLDRLGKVLAGAGWRTAARYEECPALLRVWHPVLPVLGLSVWVVEGPGTLGPVLVEWFRACTGDLLAPCGNESAAFAEIVRLMAPWVDAAQIAR